MENTLQALLLEYGSMNIRIMHKKLLAKINVARYQAILIMLCD